MRRAAPLPALVIPPWRRVRPLECSDGTRPRYAMSWRGLVKRVMSPSSATKVAAATSRTPRKAWGVDHRCERPLRQHGFDMCLQSVAPCHRCLDGRDTIFQHNMMYRLVELEACQPTPVQLRPGRSVVVPAVAQQEARQLLSRLAQAAHRRLTC